jgi:hypothetical protein
MNFSYNNFLKPLGESDKSIRIYDKKNDVKYVLNPFNIDGIYVRNNLLYVGFESDKRITIDFSTRNEADLAAAKLQQYVDELKYENIPHWLHMAVIEEANRFTQGPTGPTGSQGIQGPEGPIGDSGKDAYQVWLETNSGTKQEYLNSLVGPPGPTGPVAFGDTGELLVQEQTIYATQDNKDIQIVTKGAGNLLFKMDKDGWIQNLGISGNSASEIWASGCVVDDEGYIYTTGGDFTSFYAYVTKTSPNGNVIWQKQLDSYSSGEAIVYSGGKLYVLLSDQSDPNGFGNISIVEITKNGIISDFVTFDLVSFDPTYSLYNVPYGFDISVDSDGNVYFAGIQANFESDYAIIFGKLNMDSASVEWMKVVDGGVNLPDRAYSIEYKNSFVYVVGSILNDPGSGIRSDIFIAKYDTMGVRQWSKVIGSSDKYQEGLSLSVDSGQNIYISGYLNFDPLPGASQIGPYNNFYMKLDVNGNIVWSRTLDGFNRSIVCIKEDGEGSLYIVSTQGVSSTPSRPSTDIYLARISMQDGDIEWQQYISSTARDSVWANIPPISAAGHRVISLDNVGKSVYIAGLTKEGNTTYHNAALFNIDRQSIPQRSYGNWDVVDASFASVPFNFGYNNATTNIPSISISDTLLDDSVQSVTRYSGLTLSSMEKDVSVSILSPNTELFVKGIINIDNNYTFPRSAGKNGQILTYGEDIELLEWKDQKLKLSFNDYQTAPSWILGSASMDSLLVDPVHGIVDGLFDDEYFEAELPFPIIFMGNTYEKVYIGSNSFVTFGGGFSAFSGYTEKNPPLSGIFIESGDRSVNKIYTRTTPTQFTIRYEGNIMPSGPSLLVEPELEWEITFSSDGRIDVSIGNNEAYGTGFSKIKSASAIKVEIDSSPNSGFRIFKGYGKVDVDASMIYYGDTMGMSYSVSPDPLNDGLSIVSIDYERGTSDSLVAESGSTVIEGPSSFTFRAGTPYGMTQSVRTSDVFGAHSGIYAQFKLPIMNDDSDQTIIGLEDSAGNIPYYLILSHNLPNLGVISTYGPSGYLNAGLQTYSEGDIFSIHFDGVYVRYLINGVLLPTGGAISPFMGSESDVFRLVFKTAVQTYSPSFLSKDYFFDSIRYYPTGKSGREEKMLTLPNADTPVVEYDMSNGTIWYHSSPASDYTASFSNVPSGTGRAVSATIVISQASTGYLPTDVVINGSPISVKWEGGTYSAGTNSVDVVDIKMISIGGSWAHALGKITNFS